jgi:hypothetical protein
MVNKMQQQGHWDCLKWPHKPTDYQQSHLISLQLGRIALTTLTTDLLIKVTSVAQVWQILGPTDFHLFLSLFLK